MKRLVILVGILAATLLTVSACGAGGLSNANAKMVITGWLQNGGFPRQWGGGDPNTGGRQLKRLDLVDVKTVKKIKVPEHLTGTCENIWIAVAHVKGASHTIQTIFSKAMDYPLDQEGTFTMCQTYQKHWEIELN